MKPNRLGAFDFLAGLRACGLAGLRACGLALLLVLAPSIWAQCIYFDAFKDNGNGTVTDPRSNIVWQQCAVGQSWNGLSCMADGKRMTWWDAMRAAKADQFLGKTDWRLPTKVELESIVGKYKNCENAKRAVSTVFQPIKDGNLGWFWSSSPVMGGSSEAWLIAFSNSGDNHMHRSYTGTVRFVRAGQSSASLEFNREFARIDHYERAHPGSESTSRADTATQQRSGDYENLHQVPRSSGISGTT